MAGIHDGHRERLRTRVKNYGVESLEDHEKLEYLLYPFIPRRDTNPIAHDLLTIFGSFKKVLDASVEDLVVVKGMTEKAALFLHSLPEILSAYILSEKESRLCGPESVAKYLYARIGRKEEEHFLVLYLDEGFRLLKTDCYTAGKSREVTIDREKIVRNAVKCRAKCVVLGHNHPRGTIAPSTADIDATNRIVQALGVVNIKLGDHVIVSNGGEFYSMSMHRDLIEPVSLDGPAYKFAESLIRRENDVNRLLVSKK